MSGNHWKNITSDKKTREFIRRELSDYAYHIYIQYALKHPALRNFGVPKIRVAWRLKQDACAWYCPEKLEISVSLKQAFKCHMDLRVTIMHEMIHHFQNAVGLGWKLGHDECAFYRYFRRILCAGEGFTEDNF